MSAPAADAPTVDGLRKSVKELQGELQMSLIRIQEGEEVYKKFVQAGSTKAFGLTDEQLKLLSACKKEVAEDKQKPQKEYEKTQKIQLQGTYIRRDRYLPGNTVERKFSPYVPEVDGGLRPTLGGAGDRGYRVENDKTNSLALRRSLHTRGCCQGGVSPVHPQILYTCL